MLNRALEQTAFCLCTLALFAAPWVFGAWEMWWFWPLAGLLLLAGALQSARLILYACRPPQPPPGAGTSPTQRRLLLALGLFLAYACLRALLTPVRMDAERSLLLFLLPIALGAQIVFGFNGRQRRFLYWTLFANLALLCLYGIINHHLTGSRLVLWAPGFERYYSDHRATGSFYCPDHFSGAMELAVCLALGLLCARRSSGWQRLAGLALALPAIGAIILSKSRGGGLTLIVIALGLMLWAFPHLPTTARRWARLSILCFLVAMTVGFTFTATAYTRRFSHYFNWQQARHEPPAQALRTISTKLAQDWRPRIMAAAWRAWRTAPWVGIGAGMHATLWPHIAPTPDGDRALGIRPSHTNLEFHATQAHNDWLQLLEEYGAIGFLLFLLPAGIGLHTLARINREAALAPLPDNLHGFDVSPDALPLTALLAIAAMGFHSLGDFNLQIPAINWMFASILALPLVRA